MRLLAAFFIALLLPFSATAAPKGSLTACSCTPPAFTTRITQAERIFTGTVRSIEVAENMVQPGRTDPPVIVTFDVEEWFKDNAGKQTQLHTSLTRVTCAGYPFEEGKTYLVYGYLRVASSYEYWSLYDFKTGTIGTGGLCAGTAEIDKSGVSAEIAQLRELKASGDYRLVPPKPER